MKNRPNIIIGNIRSVCRNHVDVPRANDKAPNSAMVLNNIEATVNKNKFNAIFLSFIR